MLQFIENLKEEDHKKALVATLVFIMLMILFFLLVSLEYPDPPIEEKVVEIEMEFGSEYEGGSTVSSAETPVEPEPVQESAIDQETQDESPVVVTKGEGKSKTSTNTTKPKPNPTPTPDPKPKVDDGLAFPGGGTSGNGGGNGTGFGTGGGVGGGGSGDQPGAGTSNTSRKLKSKGSVPGNSQEEGKIALDIYVDEFGKVTRTKFNESKSTSGSAYLKDLAEKNALTYRYESIPGAPVQFVGTVIFTFRKQ